MRVAISGTHCCGKSTLIDEFLSAHPDFAHEPEPYTVLQEDDTFRVLRVRFGPKEKSPMHDHPAGCFYFVTDLQSKQTGPDGKVTDGIAKAGDAGCGPAFRHAPENVSGKPYEVIVYELKPTKKP